MSETQKNTTTNTQTQLNSTSPSFGDWYITDAPKTTDGIYGQSAVVKAIKAQQKSGIFSKNTFFQGQFGSGKTALAKILAKSIACKCKGPNGAPCGECPTCKAVDTETFNRDVIYVNAEEASADDVRARIDTMMKFPAHLDAAKVMIIDETQALSPQAVDAFLTATQSPKPGYYFIFTAMDKLKGPKSGALQTRCKVWKMKNPTFSEIYLYLAEICKKKGLIQDQSIPKDFFGDGLQFIAENSEYSYRKAIQLLEQAYTARVFTREEMRQSFGIVSRDDAIAALIDIANGKKTELAWNAIQGLDYQDKFPLMLACIGDAESIRAFGNEFIEPEESWKWQRSAELASAAFFPELRDAFLELSTKAYIQRGEWKIICARLLERAGSAHLKEGVTANPEAPKTGRRKPATI